MLLSAVYVLVVAQLSSEIPEGLMNNPVFLLQNGRIRMATDTIFGAMLTKTATRM